MSWHSFFDETQIHQLIQRVQIISIIFMVFLNEWNDYILHCLINRSSQSNEIRRCTLETLQISR